jgi:hypothetical protein
MEQEQTAGSRQAERVGYRSTREISASLLTALRAVRRDNRAAGIKTRARTRDHSQLRVIHAEELLASVC